MFIKPLKTFLEKNSKFIALFLLVVIVVFIAVLDSFNEIHEGGPDGYWHYYFSRYAYENPKFFLHHWGKPIFIFLSAPFAQFGFYALNLFNIICGGLTAWVAFKWCKDMGFKYAPIAIILVLFTPMYFLVVQSSLTEPLFSLLLIYSAYLIYSEKYISGAILASFLMYSRTEGTFVILIFVTYYLLVKKWKLVPLFATAFLVYSCIGFFSGHDFLWFFTENPYAEKSVYGKGSWTHFFKIYDVIFGTPLLIFLGMGLIVLLWLIFKRKQYKTLRAPERDLKIFLLAFIPSLVFFMFHVYAWAMGKFASAGLERVMACISPTLIIVAMYFFHSVYKVKFGFIRFGIIVASLFFFIKSTFGVYKYPLRAFAGEKVIREASGWIKENLKEGANVYYLQTAICFYCDFNPFAPNTLECPNFPMPGCGKDMPVKMYYIWDSQFSDQFCPVKKADLEKCDNFVKMKEFSANDGYDFKLIIYESK